MRPSVAEGRHRAPKVIPNGLRKRPGDVRKSTKNPRFDLGGALGALGTSPGTPPTRKMSENTLFSRLPNIYNNCVAVVQQERVRTNSRRFSAPGFWFQTLAMLLSSARACEKIRDGPVPSASVSKNADGPERPVIFQHPQTQQRQASPSSHSPQRGG